MEKELRSSEIPMVGMSTDICQSKNSAPISSQDSTANQLIKVDLQNDCYASVCIAYFANNLLLATNNRTGR